MKNVIENKCFFLSSVTSIRNLPDESLKEICFWGRSNVGKSSLLNSITNHNIARISKTPGRTTALNFFEIEKKIRLVDLPGYGYAKRSKVEIYKWNSLILDYLESRKNLLFVFLLIDSRHGIKKNDSEAINLLQTLNNNFFIVLTKIDKINKNELNNCYSNASKTIKKRNRYNQKIYLTSSKKNQGIKELTKTILEVV